MKRKQKDELIVTAVSQIVNGLKRHGYSESGKAGTLSEVTNAVCRRKAGDCVKALCFYLCGEVSTAQKEPAIFKLAAQLNKSAGVNSTQYDKKIPRFIEEFRLSAKGAE